MAPCQSQYYPVWCKILDKIGKNEGIIDLGCGSGQFAKLALNRGYDFLYGIDFSYVALIIAWELNPNFEDRFFLMDLYKPRHYPKACIVLSEVLEHISGDLGLLRNLDAGTHLVFTLPNYLTPSHIRAMRTEDEIRERYGDIVNIKSIESVMMNPGHGWKIWVVDGEVI